MEILMEKYVKVAAERLKRRRRIELNGGGEEPCLPR